MSITPCNNNREQTPPPSNNNREQSPSPTYGKNNSKLECPGAPMRRLHATSLTCEQQQARRLRLQDITNRHFPQNNTPEQQARTRNHQKELEEQATLMKLLKDIHDSLPTKEKMFNLKPNYNYNGSFTQNEYATLDTLSDNQKKEIFKILSKEKKQDSQLSNDVNSGKNQISLVKVTNTYRQTLQKLRDFEAGYFKSLNYPTYQSSNGLKRHHTELNDQNNDNPAPLKRKKERKKERK